MIDLAELQRFFNHPVKAFLRQRLQLHLPARTADQSDDLPTTLGGLERWSVAERLLRARLAGHANDEWERHERALGTLPPGGLGDVALGEIEETVDGLLDRRDPARRRPDSVTIACRSRSCSPTARASSAPSWVAAQGPVRARPSSRSARSRQSIAWRRGSTSWSSWRPTPRPTGAASSWAAPRSRASSRRSSSLGVAALATIATAARSTRSRSRSTATAWAARAHPALRRPLLQAARAAQRGGTTGSRSAAMGTARTRRTAWRSETSASTTSVHCLRVDDDPPGSSAGRAARFADYLWGTIEASTAERNMSAPPVFSLLDPLPSGCVAIEASAGTGKTYTLAGLVVRYVAEEAVRVDELLMVTFTRAAAAELRDRVRSRLSEAAAALRGPYDIRGRATSSSRSWPARDRELRLGRLEQAVADFDGATITTIHGFASRCSPLWARQLPATSTRRFSTTRTSSSERSAPTCSRRSRSPTRRPRTQLPELGRAFAACRSRCSGTPASMSSRVPKTPGRRPRPLDCGASSTGRSRRCTPAGALRGRSRSTTC